MSFSAADWKKISKAQKEALFALKRKAQDTKNVSVSNTETTSSPVVQSNSQGSSNAQNTHDVRNLLSNNTSRNSSSFPTQVIIDGRTYTSTYCYRSYSINQHQQKPCGSLMDGGANGGLSGSDVTVIAETLLTVDVTGINDNTLKKVPVCTVAGLIDTQHGPIIGIFHQYAHNGNGKTIHSVSQLRHFGTIVDDIPRSFGGK